jgi:hypothetical protein
MKLFLNIIIILIILIIFYIINLSIKKTMISELFTNPYGATPLDGNWGNYPGNSNVPSGSNTAGPCKYIDPVTHNLTFGITFDNIKCYSLTNNNGVNGVNGENNIPGLQQNAMAQNPPQSNAHVIPDSAISYNICYSNTSNFNDICKQENPNYGIKKITPCNDTTSSVECGANYLNGVDYGNKVTITPCLNKTDDFDNWCRFYTNGTNMPSGYNVNSIGAKYILEGKNGDCYLENGKPDTNSARGVCDLNHLEEIPKLDPLNNKIGYNVFTSCKPLKGTNFTTECATELNNPYNETYADQIMAYDCNPGYGRAKCLKKSDKTTFETDISYALNTLTNAQNAGNVKKCC